MTRSPQSAHVLVNPHAMWVLLPVTRVGTPGSVVPMRRCASDGFSGSFHSIEARYHLLGTRIGRCLSLGFSAWPFVGNRPSTPPLLLPRPPPPEKSKFPIPKI